MTETTAQIPTPETERAELPFPAAHVEETLKLLVKAVRAHQLYLQNNPTYQRAIEALKSSFAPMWERVEAVTLSVSETGFRWLGHEVLSEPDKSSDSLPWLFYKDGIREVTMRRGFEDAELLKLLAIFQRLRKTSADEDDLLTMLWSEDFLLLRYQYVDLATDSAGVASMEPAGELPEQVDPRQVAEESEEETTKSSVVSMSDFDATLYFLDQKEIDYLQDEVRKEYVGDLRRNVLAMVLDIFELQGEPLVRDEIAGILENFMLHLLSAGQLSAVAYLLRESEQALARARDLNPAQKERIAGLAGRLSQPEALSQLLQSLDESAVLPEQADLDELFAQLRGGALETVFAWLDRLQNARVRSLLENAAERLASSNTSELVRLIGVADETVVREAIKRAGALRTASAVAPLTRVMSERDAALRLAAVQAMIEIGSPGALQLLERGVDDADRDVRVTTVRALAARAHRPALPRIEAAVTGKLARDADLTEKMALFEAYGAMCGDAGVSYLDGVLNGRGFLGRREEPEMRACAAIALGRVGTERARGALQKAHAEKDVIVRNAVSKALRGSAA